MAFNTIQNNIQVVKNKIKIPFFIFKINLFWKLKLFLLLFSIYLILEGLFGNQIGILNPAITLIWIGWWLALVFVYLPFNAKNWCAICPIPTFGQLYHRYAPLKWLKIRKFKKSSSLYGLLPLLLFLLFSALSVPISTVPFLTGFILLLLFAFSTIIDIYYDERTFCKHICPINPLLQTYNRNNIIALETMDFAICTTQHEKTCMIGDINSNGCDWGFFPGKLKVNENDCTNCGECINSCTYDNLRIKTKKKGFLPDSKEKISNIASFSPMFFLAISIIYSISKIATINPFHKFILLKDLPDLIFTIVFESLIVFVLIPILYLLFVGIPIHWSFLENKARLNVLKRSTFVSIPLSLTIWILFSIYLILPNIDLIIGWIADPFSFQWNILNIKSITIYSGTLKELLNYLGQIILIVGYYLSLYYSYKFVSSLKLNLKLNYSIVIGQFTFYTIVFLFSSFLYL